MRDGLEAGLAPTGGLRVMALGDLRIGVRAEAGHLAWLEEFLCPWFEPVAGGRCDTTVTLGIDAARHAALLRQGARPGGPRAAVFVLDSRLACHPRWAEDGVETVLDEELGVFYRVGQDGAAAEVLAARGDAAARVALMRVVRELGTVHVQRQGALLLHAAAFGLGGRGVAVVGPKGAGKTTLLLHALCAGGATFVANDRLAVEAAPDGPWARGLPSIVAVRSGTLARAPHLGERLAKHPYRPWRTVAESRARPRKPPMPGQAMDLTPAQLCDALGAAPRARLPLARLLFLRHEPARPGVGLAPIGPEDALARLSGGLFGGGRGSRTSELFSGPAGPVQVAAPRLREMCRALAASAPAYECRLGEPIGETVSGSGAILRDLARAVGMDPSPPA